MKKKWLGLSALALGLLLGSQTAFAANGDVEGTLLILPNNEARDNAMFQRFATSRRYLAGYDDITVELVDATTGATVSTVLSGNNSAAEGYGAFIFSGVPDGTYRIRVASEGPTGIEHVIIPSTTMSNLSDEYLFQDSLLSETFTIQGGEMVDATGTPIDVDQWTAGNQAPSISFAVVRRAWGLQVSTEFGSFLMRDGSSRSTVSYYPGGTAIENNMLVILGTLELDSFQSTLNTLGTTLVQPVLTAEEEAFGYEFLGWSVDATTVANYPELAAFQHIPRADRTDTTVIRALSAEQVLALNAKGDMHLHAEYVAPTHVVTFATDLEKGTIENDGSVAYLVVGNTATLGTLPVPTPAEGYEFIGWFVDLTTNTIPESRISSMTITRDWTFYAKYRKLPETQEVSANPVVLRLFEGDTAVTGLGVKGSSITVTFKDGTSIETTVAEDGTWSVAVPETAAIEYGDNVSVVQIEEKKLKSAAVDATAVKQDAAPSRDAITRYVDEMGIAIASEEKGAKDAKTIQGYEFIRTVVDADGNTVHIYKTIVSPVDPSNPSVPGSNNTPAARSARNGGSLPYTGTAQTPVIFAGAILAVLGLLFAIVKKK